jgi:CheY-like chemotaxis protein
MVELTIELGIHFIVLKQSLDMGYRLGPIIILSSDEEDQVRFKEVFNRLKIPNELKFFTDPENVYVYVETTKDKPFIIFSEMKLPTMSGAKLKDLINLNEQTSRKSIPFVFLADSSTHEEVLASYKCSSQGYFVKSKDIEAFTHLIELIFDYWKLARHPDPNRT